MSVGVFDRQSKQLNASLMLCVHIACGIGIGQWIQAQFLGSIIPVTFLSEQFPRGYDFLVDQLNRAGLSIATNRAEGNGGFTKADQKNFFIIARGSVQECIPLLELSRRKGLIEDRAIHDLRDQLEVIAQMLSGLINGLESGKRDWQIRMPCALLLNKSRV